MKIYNKIVIGWNESTQQYDDVLYEDSFEYTGEIATATAACCPDVFGDEPFGCSDTTDANCGDGYVWYGHPDECSLSGENSYGYCLYNANHRYRRGRMDNADDYKYGDDSTETPITCAQAQSLMWCHCRPGGCDGISCNWSTYPETGCPLNTGKYCHSSGVCMNIATVSPRDTLNNNNFCWRNACQAGDGSCSLRAQWYHVDDVVGGSQNCSGDGCHDDIRHDYMQPPYPSNKYNDLISDRYCIASSDDMTAMCPDTTLVYGNTYAYQILNSGNSCWFAEWDDDFQGNSTCCSEREVATGRGSCKGQCPYKTASGHPWIGPYWMNFGAGWARNDDHYWPPGTDTGHEHKWNHWWPSGSPDDGNNTARGAGHCGCYEDCFFWGDCCFDVLEHCFPDLPPLTDVNDDQEWTIAEGGSINVFLYHDEDDGVSLTDIDYGAYPDRLRRTGWLGCADHRQCTGTSFTGGNWNPGCVNLGYNAQDTLPVPNTEELSHTHHTPWYEHKMKLGDGDWVTMEKDGSSNEDGIIELEGDGFTVTGHCTVEENLNLGWAYGTGKHSTQPQARFRCPDGSFYVTVDTVLAELEPQTITFYVNTTDFRDDIGAGGHGNFSDVEYAQFRRDRTDTFTVTLTGENEAPVFTSEPVTEATENSTYTYNITTSDPDAGDTVTIIATDLPTWGSTGFGWITLTDNGDGTALLRGSPGDYDTDQHHPSDDWNSVTLRVTDEGGDFNVQQFDITVANLHDEPDFYCISDAPCTAPGLTTTFITEEETEKTIYIEMHDVDYDQDIDFAATVIQCDNVYGCDEEGAPRINIASTVEDYGSSAPGSPSITTAELTVVPADDFVGFAYIKLTATDAAGRKSNRFIRIGVTEVWDMPEWIETPTEDKCTLVSGSEVTGILMHPVYDCTVYEYGLGIAWVHDVTAQSVNSDSETPMDITIAGIESWMNWGSLQEGDTENEWYKTFTAMPPEYTGDSTYTVTFEACAEAGVEIDTAQLWVPTYHLNDWNLVSLRLNVPDNSPTAVFPEATPGTLYKFDGTYISVMEMLHGEGYWIQFHGSGYSIIVGDIVSSVDVDMESGWNLIGGPTEHVEDWVWNWDGPGSGYPDWIDPEDIIVPGTLYGFSGTYDNSGDILGGMGYWLNAYAAGTIHLPGGGSRDTRTCSTPTNTMTFNLNIIETNAKPVAQSYEFDFPVLYGVSEGQSQTITFHQQGDWNNEPNDNPACGGDVGNVNPFCISDIDMGHHPYTNKLAIEITSAPYRGTLKDSGGNVISPSPDPILIKEDSGAAGRITVTYILDDDPESIIYDGVDYFRYRVVECIDGNCLEFDEATNYDYCQGPADPHPCCLGYGIGVCPERSETEAVIINITTVDVPPVIQHFPESGIANLPDMGEDYLGIIPLVEGVHESEGTAATISLLIYDAELTKMSQADANDHLVVHLLGFGPDDGDWTGIYGYEGDYSTHSIGAYDPWLRATPGPGVADTNTGVYTQQLNIWFDYAPAVNTPFDFDIAVYDVVDGQARKCMPTGVEDNFNEDCWNQTNVGDCIDEEEYCAWLPQRARINGSYFDTNENIGLATIGHQTSQQSASTLQSSMITDDFYVAISGNQGDVSDIEWGVGGVEFSRKLDSEVCSGIALSQNEYIAAGTGWSYEVEFSQDNTNWYNVAELLSPSSTTVEGTHLYVRVRSNDLSADWWPRDQYWPGGQDAEIIINLNVSYTSEVQGSPVTLYDEGSVTFEVTQDTTPEPIAPAPPYRACDGGWHCSDPAGNDDCDPDCAYDDCPESCGTGGYCVNSYAYGFQYGSWTDSYGGTGQILYMVDQDGAFSHIDVIINSDTSDFYAPMTVYDLDDDAAADFPNGYRFFNPSGTSSTPTHINDYGVVYAEQVFLGDETSISYQFTDGDGQVSDTVDVLVEKDPEITPVEIHFTSTTSAMVFKQAGDEDNFSPGDDTYPNPAGIGWCTSSSGVINQNYTDDVTCMAGGGRNWAYEKIGGCKTIQLSPISENYYDEPGDCGEGDWTELSINESYVDLSQVQIITDMTYTTSEEDCVRILAETVTNGNMSTDWERASYMIVQGNDFSTNCTTDFRMIAVDPDAHSGVNIGGVNYDDNAFQCSAPNETDIYVGIDECTTSCTDVYASCTVGNTTTWGWDEQTCCEANAGPGIEWNTTYEDCMSGGFNGGDPLPNSDFGFSPAECWLADDLFLTVIPQCQASGGVWIFGDVIYREDTGTYHSCDLCGAAEGLSNLAQAGCYTGDEIGFTYGQADTLP